jgi:hypothetical protein
LVLVVLAEVEKPLETTQFLAQLHPLVVERAVTHSLLVALVALAVELDTKVEIKVEQAQLTKATQVVVVEQAATNLAVVVVVLVVSDKIRVLVALVESVFQIT